MEEKRSRRNKAEKTRDFSFILFKNAYNGSGSVRKKDVIGRHKYEYSSVYILWSLSEEQMDLVCSLLQEQLGPGYKVVRPKNSMYCIEIVYIGEGVKPLGDTQKEADA